MKGNSFFLEHRRKIIVLIFLPIMTACTTWMISKSMTPIYRATATLIVSTTSLGTYDAATKLNTNITDRLYPKTYAEIAGSQGALEELSARLNQTPGPEQLRSMIKIVPVKDRELLQINVEDSSPERAAFIANSLVAVLQEREKYLWGTDYIKTVHPAYPPLSPVKPKMRANVVAAGSSSFIAAALWVLYTGNPGRKMSQSIPGGT